MNWINDFGHKEVGMKVIRRRLARVRGRVERDVEPEIETTPEFLDLEAMAQQVVGARYKFATTFKGMNVAEDKDLEPNAFEIRVGPELFQEILMIEKKKLQE